MTTDSTDGSSLEHLGAAARHVLKLGTNAYAALVPTTTGLPEARDALELIKPADLTAAPAIDRLAAAAALSGLWLWHDFLDESHTISQGLDTPHGSLWHAIMHRREGDFSNAKYWFRKCPHHRAYLSISPKVDEVTHGLPADKSVLRMTMNGWDPMAFVDFVERVHAAPADDPRRAVATTIQRIEWRAAFEQCVRDAAGR